MSLENFFPSWLINHFPNNLRLFFLMKLAGNIPNCLIFEIFIFVCFVLMTSFINPFGESDQLIVHLNLVKNGWAKRSFASKIQIKNILTRSFASRFLLRFAQPFLAKFRWANNWSLSPQGLTLIIKSLSINKIKRKITWSCSKKRFPFFNFLVNKKTCCAVKCSFHSWNTVF